MLKLCDSCQIGGKQYTLKEVKDEVKDVLVKNSEQLSQDEAKAAQVIDVINDAPVRNKVKATHS